MLHWKEKCIPYAMPFTASLYINPGISGDQLNPPTGIPLALNR